MEARVRWVALISVVRQHSEETTPSHILNAVSDFNVPVIGLPSYQQALGGSHRLSAYDRVCDQHQRGHARVFRGRLSGLVVLLRGRRRGEFQRSGAERL